MKTVTRKSEPRGSHGQSTHGMPVGKNGSKLRIPKQASETQKTDEIPPDGIQFRRDDWIDFRDPNRISSRAGVPFEQLPHLVVKELCDDALDASGDVEFGLLDVGDDTITFVVADKGP